MTTGLVGARPTAGTPALWAMRETGRRSGRGLILDFDLCQRFALSTEGIPSLWLHPDVAETLRGLRADGWRLAVLTNGVPAVQALKVSSLGLRPLVDGIIYANEHASTSSGAGALRAALRALSLPATRCVSVGTDVAADVRAARSLGIPTIRIAGPEIMSDPDEDADIVITSLPQLPDAATLLLTLVGAHAG